MTSAVAVQRCRRFSLAEIQSCTGDFSDAHVIGKGGFGKVYKGTIDNGSLIVAVKRLASNSNQGETEFTAEMETLTKVRHRNLVDFIGYCDEEDEMILVYEYMANGTLADHLYKFSNGVYGSSMTWIDRLKICIGAGRGLDYLHFGCSIIHRDVKSTNILLDENFTAKVSDFGLAKHLSVSNSVSHVSASLKGTFGYIDPSYFLTGRLTRASDTYAFGVVLLEVLTGKPAVDRRMADEGNLFMNAWAQENIRNGKVNQIVASDLKGEISEGSLKSFVGVVKGCLYYEPKKRLTMTQAVAKLEFALQMQVTRGARTRRLQLGPLSAFWNRVKPYVEKEEAELESEDNVNMLPIAVPAADMLAVTDAFSRKCWIANGTNGSIFKGLLQTGKDAAIKRLYKKLPDQEFLDQVSEISSLKHENVVELHGYCADGGLQVLVYEFAPRRSLHDILHGPQGCHGLASEPGPGLSWPQRIKIALGVAKALHYIHNKGLVHGNIKSSNVLVFDDEVAKISDRRLSTCPCKQFSHVDDRHPSVDDRHPYASFPCSAYHPPEYEDKSSREGDVFSFGVVLHELLTGRETYREGEKSAMKWAQRMYHEDKVEKIVDSKLRGAYPLEKDAIRINQLVSLCLQWEAEFRPDMGLLERELRRQFRSIIS